ncbi:ArnT family glycosyltransferase [Pseudoduganella violacea]|uniref:4-amino-4-deoxy-L-arabinose transferase-like glycosyltransferase n=1 Tax=Pseudoduganella violacea TaxID=1715466 RepID=A0A7W5BEN1_9BURK|nr:glycosyltransferase family 39 protein [Pseudoduganella violacea]MBB3121738.1 4-amino-4-deoxy-L-arabinose transferase-like glycosyltransferase [Pseudoduganella violacea]
MTDPFIGNIPLEQRNDAAPPVRRQGSVPGIWRTWFVLAVLLLLLCRIGLMWWGPLADTTEARYGELARQTATNGYWLMPHMNAATPFFAKPPLSTWASAATAILFGINEFALRLPALLAALLTLWTAHCFARALGLREPGLVVPVLASMPLFFVAAGAVMTDAIQMAIVWGGQYAAWRAFTAEEKASRRRWARIFWALVGLGGLAKGLATWALLGLPIIAFALLQREARQVARCLLDAPGILLATAICLPWYVAAELAYPGFLQYFIVGEHFARFLVPGWQGDRYGLAHRQPLGAIWLFWIGAILPWLPVFMLRLLSVWSTRRLGSSPAERFLWCATLVPLLFFTGSRNIIWTYALTAVPPFAVLVAQWLEQRPAVRWPRIGKALMAYALLVVLLSPLLLQQQNANSDRALVLAHASLSTPGSVLAYATQPTFSSAFYTAGAFTQQATGEPMIVMDNDAIAREALAPERILFRGRSRSLVAMP